MTEPKQDSRPHAPTRLSGRKLINAIDRIGEAVAFFDDQNRLVLCNEAFRLLYPHAMSLMVAGSTNAEIISAAVAGGDIDLMGETLEDFIKHSSEASQRQVWREFRLGNGRWIKSHDSFTEDGFRVAVKIDITEQKTREEALTAAKEMAEVANRSKTEFLANISHELRTPLNAIIGFSEIIRNEIFGPLGSPQYKEYMNDVLDSAKHLLGVINDILDVAKAEAGKLELQEGMVVIAELVRSATRLVRERVHRAELTLDVKVLEGLPLVHADERKLKQVLLNLMTNAVKFTQPGGSIVMASRVDEAGDLELTVTDTGIGIAPDDIPVALAPFGQVDSRLNRRFEGTGLGLPLSRALIELHGGTLSLHSTVGVGTTVTLKLPASRLLQAHPLELRPSDLFRPGDFGKPQV